LAVVSKARHYQYNSNIPRLLSLSSSDFTMIEHISKKRAGLSTCSRNLKTRKMRALSALGCFFPVVLSRIPVATFSIVREHNNQTDARFEMIPSEFATVSACCASKNSCTRETLH
jgi:hypothetical protein